MDRLKIFIVALTIVSALAPTSWTLPNATAEGCGPGGCSLNPGGNVGGYTPQVPKTGATPSVGNPAPAGGLGAAKDRVFIEGASASYYLPFGKMLGIPANSTAISTAAETGQTFYEWAQSFILAALKKRILDQMVRDIVYWIQGGGEPRFITDWKSFLADAGNIAVGDLAVAVAGAGICQPFRQNILNNLTPKRQSYSFLNSSITCTLDDIVSNIENFYKDFSNGGWEAYIASWAPNNHPLPVFIETRSAKYITQTQNQRLAELEGVINQGFLSALSCSEDLTNASSSKDIDRDGKKGDIPYTCQVVTPGVITGELVKKAVGADFDFIVNAEQLADYVAAIVDALFYRLITDTGGLLAFDTSGADYTPNPADLSQNPCSAFAPTTPARSACDNYFGTNFGNSDLGQERLLGDIDATLIPLQEALVFASSSRTLASTTLDFLAAKKVTRPLCVDEDDVDDLTTQLTQLDTTIASTNVTVLELNSIRADVGAINPTTPTTETWVALTNAQTALSRLSDPAGALRFRDQMSADYVALDEKINGAAGVIGIHQRVLACTGTSS